LGQIHKIKDVYYIEFFARGLLYSQPAGTDLKEAQRLLQQVEEKIAGGEALTVVRHIDLTDFYARFLAQAGEQHTPKTVLRFAGTIDDFKVFLGEHFPEIRQLAQLTPAVIESYKAYLMKTQEPKIVNLSILIIRDILEFGIKLGFLNDNPSLHVRLLPWPESQPRKLTARHELARQLFSGGVGLAKAAQLLKLADISRAIYFASLIPLSREDMYQ